MNLFSKLRRKKKGKEKKKPMIVTKENLKIFLEGVTKSVNANFNGQESNALEKDLEREFNHWLKNTIFAGKPLDPDSVKIGVVLGILQTLRKINENEDKTKVSYIH